MTPNSSDRDPFGGGRFVSTQWSLVLAAGQQASAESEAALDRLCRAYWPPLYAYVRRRVTDVHEAHDLTQAFFERLLEKRYLARADPQRGRFRAFLLTAFKHFLSKEWDAMKAQKRGSGQPRISLDFASQDSSATLEPAADQLTADQLYERQWAITLLDRVMRRLQREMERSGKGSQFHLLKEHLVNRGEQPYSAVAAELGLSESAARMAASRLRSRYRELLRDEIAQTVSSPEDIDDEIARLFATFSG